MRKDPGLETRETRGTHCEAVARENQTQTILLREMRATRPRITTARNDTAMKKRVWVGLVGVTPQPGATKVLSAAAKGAFVNALAYAADEAEYKTAVEQALGGLGLTPYEFEDVETFSERISKWEVDEALRDLADEVVATGDVRFGTFHNYTGVE